MDKNAIKKYAVWARNELIARVSQKAQQYGITAEGYGDKNADSVNGVLLSATEKKQRQALIAKIDAEGFEQVMEEVAYTWFNRFTALRFMEVNNYLPSHTRVFTNEANEFKPQILADAISLELEGLDMDKVFELKNANKDEELYKYLLIVQCNALSSILPGMFQKIEDYTELLLPDYLLREGSVIEQMISMIAAENFDMNDENGQIEIIGWLYQYYISEKHDEVVDPLYGKTIKKEDLPAATQLFTTDWVVRYILDNSLGRYWIERKNNSNLGSKLDFLVLPKSGKFVHIDEIVSPMDIKVFDPCVGSGHFLVYAFDILMNIYVEYGYSEREAAIEILNNNLFGIDIDDRATQLAYFAVVMKARKYDRRLFSRAFTVNICSMKETEGLSGNAINYFINNDSNLEKEFLKLTDCMHNAKEIGSIVSLPSIDWKLIDDRLVEIQEKYDLFSEMVISEIAPFIEATKILSRKYTIVVTNPPYFNKYDKKLKKYLQTYYKDYLGDLFSVFMYRNFDYCAHNGYAGFMTPFTWMFIQSYEKLRNHIIENKRISTLVQMEYSAYEEATVPICTFVFENSNNNDNPGQYIRLSSFRGGMEVQKQKVLEAIDNPNCNYYFEIKQGLFPKIPGTPIAYWVKESFFDAFDNKKVEDLVISKAGIVTGSDPYFVRMWQEVNYADITFEPEPKSLPKYVLMQKGGPYRQYFGNNIFIVKIRDMYDDSKVNVSVRRGDREFYYREGIGWSLIGSNSGKSFRLINNSVCGTATPMLYPKDPKQRYYLLGLLNSPVAGMVLDISNPTLNLLVTDVCKVPVIYDEEVYRMVSDLAEENYNLQKEDWDNYEQSWDFETNPLIKIKRNLKADNCKLSDLFSIWEKSCQSKFELVKTNQQKINSLLIGLYDLGYELSSEVSDKSISMNVANVQYDIRCLISYAVGCMFGRYSLDKYKISFAGGDYASDSDCSFKADEDNVIPITDDEYFTDDIVSRFIEFVEVAFGKQYLEDNLTFIATALGGEGSSRDVLRKYFIEEFFADHCTFYSFASSGRRPIYWLFDSGKKNGFKCLIYMHRYQSDTIARIRTDYVHEQQSRYRTALVDLEQRINSASTSERVKLTKQLKTIQDQSEELRKYEEKIHHLADQMIAIDLDDGVKENYAKFQDVLAKIK